MSIKIDRNKLLKIFLKLQYLFPFVGLVYILAISLSEYDSLSFEWNLTIVLIYIVLKISIIEKKVLNIE